MKYRSRTDIFATILELATEKGIGKTKIMYVAFLSYNQINNFLNLLIDHGLLEYDETQRFYRTTKKGFQYLELYRQMEELLKNQRTGN
jgi:predicted transcriptional regulator